MSKRAQQNSVGPIDGKPEIESLTAMLHLPNWPQAHVGTRRGAKEQEPEFMTVAKIRDRLPIKISEVEIRQRLRMTGLGGTHRRQWFLPIEKWRDFVETFSCSHSNSGASKLLTGSKSSGTSRANARSPKSSSATAHAAIAKAMQKPF